MATLQNVEASCAICGASSQHVVCEHESQSLERALEQAIRRWSGFQEIRDWVLEHARAQVSDTFEQLKLARYQAHVRYLQTLPCYTLYERYGDPPLTPAQAHNLRHQMGLAQSIFQNGVDEDWRRCCLKYPEVLDYYLNLVEIGFPDDRESSMRDPRFGGPVSEAKRLKARRGSAEMAKGHRKRSRRRNSRGRTPPAAPMAGSHRR